MDVNGHDNVPEWGYCTWPGCTHAAYPIWYSGEYPDDPDLLYCDAHIGSKVNALIVLLRAVLATPQWERGPVQDMARMTIGRDVYERAFKEAWAGTDAEIP